MMILIGLASMVVAAFSAKWALEFLRDGSYFFAGGQAFFAILNAVVGYWNITNTWPT